VDTLLVFGARNLGRVLARELSAEGWRVAAVARSESTIEQLKDEVPEAIGLIGDASNPEEVERIFADVGDLDLVVNAITTTPSFGGPIHEGRRTRWRLTSAHCCRASSTSCASAGASWQGKGEARSCR
jgi:NAD(P)-dependent dehydrogenase (short-subunit alcohol dehydrogenase family)